LNTLETLRGMIADKFEVEPEQIQPETTLETLGLDSLAVFDLIFDIESAFEIKVSNDEVKIVTVQDVVSMIDRLRQEQGKA
jgi:acyl carrier protein